MRLYMRPTAPNAVKVLIFAAERGVALETIDVGALPDGAFRALHPLGTVPLLDAGDGLLISESLTICRYLDEAAAGEPLFGATPDERARIGQWERRAELLLLNPAIEYIHHSHPMFAGRLRQFPEWAAAHVEVALPMVEAMEAALAKRPWLAGERFTAADITGLIGYASLVAMGCLDRPAGPALSDWAGRVATRESFAPFHGLKTLVPQG